MVILAIFTAIIFLLSYTPIGYIQLGFIKATIIHIPVIIGSILLGPKRGAFLGFIFGLTSFLSNTMTPVISSFVFSPFIPLPSTGKGSLLSLIICFVPRILVGIIPYYVYHFLENKSASKMTLNLGIAGVTGSLVNTLLVMNGIYFLFKEDYAIAREVNANGLYAIITSVIMTNGVMEAIASGVIVAIVCRSLLKNKKIQRLLSQL